MRRARVALAYNTITEDDLRATAEWLVAGHQLTKGPETLEFEAEFATAIGTREARMVNSGSSANLLAIAALKESSRLRSLVAVAPAVAWVTTISPLLELGFEVYLCDADRSNLGVDVGHLRQLFEKNRPSLLIIVHVLGHPNAMREILDLCKEFDVILIEDSCEALGSIGASGKNLGTEGSIGTHSLYYGHHLSTIEGGMVTTDDTELAELMTQLRSHGWTRDLSPARQAELADASGIDGFRSLYTFHLAGYDLRSTDLQAFIGRRQLVRLPEIAQARQRLFEMYRSLLPGYFVQDGAGEKLSAFAYGTLVRNPSETAARLAEHGIESRPLICGNMARHPFWQRYGRPIQELPVADLVHDFGMYLPIHIDLTDADVEHVADVFRSIAIPHQID